MNEFPDESPQHVRSAMAEHELYPSFKKSVPVITLTTEQICEEFKKFIERQALGGLTFDEWYEELLAATGEQW